MIFEERKALVKSYLGKTVRIEIDRPIGYVHKNRPLCHVSCELKTFLIK